MKIQIRLMVIITFLLTQRSVMGQSNTGDLLDSTLMHVKSTYSHLENFNIKAKVSFYINENKPISEATFSINKNTHEPISVCWNGYLSNYPLAFTNACLIIDTPYIKNTTYCLNVANMSTRKETGALDLLIAKYSGVAQATIPLLKLILEDKISAIDRLSNFISGDIAIDTLSESIPCYRIELFQTFTQQKIEDFKLTEEILGEGSTILTLWVDPKTYLIQQYSIALTSATGKIFLTNVFLIQSDSRENITECENCCY